MGWIGTCSAASSLSSLELPDAAQLEGAAEVALGVEGGAGRRGAVAERSRDALPAAGDACERPGERAGAAFFGSREPSRVFLRLFAGSTNFHQF